MVKNIKAIIKTNFWFDSCLVNMLVDLLFWTSVDGEKLFFENCYLMEFYQLAISKNIIYRFNGHLFLPFQMC